MYAHICILCTYVCFALCASADFSAKEVVFFADTTRSFEEKLNVAAMRFLRVGCIRPNERSRGALVCCIASKHSTMAPRAQLLKWMTDPWTHQCHPFSSNCALMPPPQCLVCTHDHRSNDSARVLKHIACIGEDVKDTFNALSKRSKAKDVLHAFFPDSPSHSMISEHYSDSPPQSLDSLDSSACA